MVEIGGLSVIGFVFKIGGVVVELLLWRCFFRWVFV
jgi:hypothetical protein